jgi:hypothetical protein
MLTRHITKLAATVLIQAFIGAVAAAAVPAAHAEDVDYRLIIKILNYGLDVTDGNYENLTQAGYLTCSGLAAGHGYDDVTASVVSSGLLAPISPGFAPLIEQAAVDVLCPQYRDRFH